MRGGLRAARGGTVQIVYGGRKRGRGGGGGGLWGAKRGHEFGFFFTAHNSRDRCGRSLMAHKGTITQRGLQTNVTRRGTRWRTWWRKLI